MNTTGTTTITDILPDDSNWKDTGCELFSACLSCPLPRCAEEEPRGKQRLRMSTRAEQMAALRREGKSTGEIARLFLVSQRTVQRALSSNGKQGRKGGVRNE